MHHPSLKIIAFKLILVAILAIVSVVDGAGVKVDGWTEVKRGWPLERQNYFVATEKGHHFIEVKLPPKLEHDLTVSLNYYYHYARAKPVIHMIPCDDNLYFVNDTSSDQKGHWLKHEQVVSRVKCHKRPELAYNVLLHDPGDVFAWTSMEIRAVVPPPPPPQKKPENESQESGNDNNSVIEETDKEPSANKNPKNSQKNDGLANLIDEDLVDSSTKQPQQEELPPKSTVVVDPSEVETQKPSPIVEGEKKDEQELPEGDSKRPDTTESTGLDGAKQPQSGLTKGDKEPPQADNPSNEEPTKGGEETPQADNPSKAKPTKPISTFWDSETGGLLPPSSSTDESETSPPPPQNKYLDFPRGNFLSQSSNAFSQLVPAYEINNSNPLSRVKRDATTASAADASATTNRQLQPIVCQPKQCDRQYFRMARFTPLFNGAPKLTAGVGELGKQKYFLNLKNQPLNFKLETSDDEGDESFEEVDTCVGFQLYMDKETELEFVLQDGQQQQKQSGERLLELIKRKAGDSGAGKWEKFNRCLSDYMPKYKFPASDNQQQQKKNQLKFAFKPRGSFKPDKLISILVDPKKTVSTRKLYPTLPYLPDVNRLPDETRLTNQWVVDRDGIRKPRVKFETRPGQQAGGRTPAAGKEERVVFIDNIDAAQESFDLTSRWLSIKDVELIDDPILFVYKLDKADWIRQIDLQFQRSGDSYDKWISKTAYTDRPTTAAAKKDHENKADITTTAVATADHSASLLELPIKMKNLDSSEFRLRVRHYLKPLNHHSANDLDQFADKSLVIRSLAFADACSSPNNCQNGATCNPTGATTFECSCLPGYLGQFCQIVRPCEVIYGNLTGNDLCSQLGARCEDRIPVMRCVWPNDKYYQCKAMFQQIDTHNKSSPVANTGHSTLDEAETSEAGANRNNNHDAQASQDEQAGQDGAAALEQLPPEEQVVKLKGIVNQQAKLILIMGVFLAASLLFAIVLIGNMIMRVRKSNRRLARSQQDNVELARRNQPGTSTAGMGVSATAPSIFTTRSSAARGGRGAAVTAYNNSAFDVE